MNDQPPAITNIPADYSCRLVYRRFKDTLVHEYSHSMRHDGTYVSSDGIGTSSRHYCGINACLERFLRSGWPERDMAARWNHRERTVAVFVDDLFLCPKCGTFRLTEIASDDLNSLGIDFRGKILDVRAGREIWKLTDECAQRVRAYCESRLGVKEFFFKECDNAKGCEEERRHALSRFRREYGVKRTNAQPPFPEPLTELKTVRPPEKLPWDEGYVYLFRCGGFYKIGLAKDANKRLSGLKTSSPFEIEMVKSWRCKRPDTIERILHDRYDKFRVRGEWFQLAEDVLQSLLTLEDLNKEFPSDETG